MAPIFIAEGIHEEAQKALELFREAAERERLTVELVLQIVKYLQRARRAPELRFEPQRIKPEPEETPGPEGEAASVLHRSTAVPNSPRTGRRRNRLRPRRQRLPGRCEEGWTTVRDPRQEGYRMHGRKERAGGLRRWQPTGNTDYRTVQRVSNAKPRNLT